ncbi:hypothetical protein [Photobacterium galatheae]|uniref:Uncharacterized protein n=1 Tax=Photobacterium galatheae TaxID=1654360 RepID=A0A066RGU8_9GAMM|nr:hypothetical protein [Photobacterium galatheae]KDM89645.1 hypothetical protein EA58_21450 [Photobacterium galatheae]MCM0149789.1 hypothetical protein [Photobacterium galatheae]
MADTPTTQTWHSGDWRSHAGSNPPYNGIEITGLPQYDDNGAFVSAAITIVDYSNNKNGVSSMIPTLTVAQGRVDIPVPPADTSGTTSGNNETSAQTNSASGTAPSDSVTASQSDTTSNTVTAVTSSEPSQSDSTATTDTTPQDSTSASTDSTSSEDDSSTTNTTSQDDHSTTASPTSEPNPDFTVNGWVSLETSLSYVHLRIHFKYGLDSIQREELGYIMGFNSILESTS